MAQLGFVAVEPVAAVAEYARGRQGLRQLEVDRRPSRTRCW